MEGVPLMIRLFATNNFNSRQLGMGFFGILGSLGGEGRGMILWPL